MRLRLLFTICLFFLIGQSIHGMTPAPKNERGYFGYVATYEDGFDRGGEIHVLEVHADGPAEKAGLVTGDRIYRVNGESFRFNNDLEMIREFTKLQPGQEVVLELNRGGEQVKTVLIVGRQPDQKKQELNRWMASAEVWFEQDGLENCRLSRDQQKLYHHLDQMVGDQGLSLTMKRTEDPLAVGVTYLTPKGDALPLERLQNTFLEALESEIPAGSSWTILLQRHASDGGRPKLVVIPQDGSRSGQKGLIVGGRRQLNR